MASGLYSEFQRHLSDADLASRSGSKWKPLERAIAKEVGCEPDSVCVAGTDETGGGLSKQLGNRLGQIERRRELVVGAFVCRELPAGGLEAIEEAFRSRLGIPCLLVLTAPGDGTWRCDGILTREQTGVARRLSESLGLGRDGVRSVAGPVRGSLPDLQGKACWIEFSSPKKKADQDGWRVGESLWAPQTPSYQVMSLVGQGDIVLHDYDGRLVGSSVVESPVEIASEHPPNPGDNEGHEEYQYIRLSGLTPIDPPLSIDGFMRDHGSAIMAIREQLRARKDGSDRYYPFVQRADGIRRNLGTYLYRVPPELFDLIVAQCRDDSQPVPFTDDDAFDGVFMSRDRFDEILGLLRLGKNVVLQGPPGVGKTYLAKRIAFALMEEVDETRVTTVQFHPSFGYEDFVEGLRPSASGFQLQHGVLRELVSAMGRRPGSRHVLVIDELNRGNLARIFGELLSLLERDKRSEESAVSLAYSREAFYLPPNLSVIALMNTADRSLAIVDFALRRRFAFVDLRPEFGERFEEHLVGQGVSREFVDDLRARISSLNGRIRDAVEELGPGFEIGHSYFSAFDASSGSAKDWFERVIRYEIAPLLREYWFDDPQLADEEIAGLLDRE